MELGFTRCMAISQDIRRWIRPKLQYNSNTYKIALKVQSSFESGPKV